MPTLIPPRSVRKLKVHRTTWYTTSWVGTWIQVNQDRPVLLSGALIEEDINLTLNRITRTVAHSAWIFS